MMTYKKNIFFSSSTTSSSFHFLRAFSSLTSLTILWPNFNRVKPAQAPRLKTGDCREYSHIAW